MMRGLAQISVMACFTIMLATLCCSGTESASVEKVDFSEDFRLAETFHSMSNCDSAFQNFANGDLKLDGNFFKSENHYERQYYDAPQVGVTGKDYTRTDIFIYPGLEHMDSLSYGLRGKSRVNGIVRDFSGTIVITDAYQYKEDYGDVYTLIGEYLFKGDSNQEGSGVFKGVWVALAICRDGILYLDDENDVADGYENRTFVGTWTPYASPSEPVLCIWGDYRLPFTSDFDTGDGEMRVNEKYMSPEWESLWSEEEIHFPENEEDHPYYKSPWW